MAAIDMRDEAIRNCEYHRIPLDDTDTQQRMQAIRMIGIAFIEAIHANADLNRPRELAIAYRHVEEAVMYVIAGLARGREARTSS